jgi:molybdate transport system substrate-binding protein
MPKALHVLSAGAAKGLVQELQPEFERDFAVTLQATFGAVGAMLERLNAGAACDLIILTRAMLDALARDGRIARSTCPIPNARRPASMPCVCSRR